MKWVIDLDGVITTNPDFFKWWTFQLLKKGNDNQVIILSARNPSRREETVKELKYWGVRFNTLVMMMEDKDRSYENQAKWKVLMIKELKPDIWIDNEFKVYERACGVSLEGVKALGINLITI